MRGWWMLMGLVALVALGCQTTVAPVGAGGVEVTVKPESRRGGQPLTVTIRNDEDREYTYNLCTDRLESLDDGNWTLAPPSLRMCAMIAFVLPASGAGEGTYDIDLGLPPGTYRLRVRLTGPDGAQFEPRSNSFTITAPE